MATPETLPAPGARLAAWARRWAAPVLAFAIGLGFLLLLHTQGQLLPFERLPHALWFLSVLALIGWWRRPAPADDGADTLRTLALGILAVFLVLSLFSSATEHKSFFFHPWSATDAAGHRTPMLVFSLLLAGLTPFLIRPPRALDRGALLAFVLLQALCLIFLCRGTAGGQALFRDDHSSMVFRFWEFPRTYPQVLNYDPFWNAGSVDYAGAACGVNALGVFYWPLWALLPTDAVYTPLVGFTLIVLIPWSAVLALRLVGGTWSAAGCAGILALGVSRYFFLWALHFGTVGSCFASASILPVCACLYRVIHLDQRKPWLGALLVLSVFGFLSWGLCMVAAGCLLLALLVNVRHWSWRKVGFLAVCGLAILLLYYRTLGVLLFHGGDLFRVLLAKAAAAAPEAAAAGSEAVAAPARDFAWIAAGWQNLLVALHEGHPLLVFLGLGGLAFLPNRGLRLWLWPVLLGLAFLASWGAALEPRMELPRMLILMFYVAILPAALSADRLLRGPQAWLAGVRAALLILLLMGGWQTAKIYLNRSTAPYTTLGEETRNLARLLAEQTPPDGRILFAGPTVHGISDHGHVAALPFLAGREMLACDYYHFKPTAVEYEYPPRPFRRPVDRVPEFIEFYNASLILTQRRIWKAYFRKSPELYDELPPHGDTAIFKPRRASSLFLQGGGTIAADFNRLDVSVTNAAETVVIKYAWADQLRAPPPVEIYPFPVAPGYDLIGIRPNGQTRFTLRFRSPW